MRFLDISGDDLPWKNTFRVYDKSIQQNLKSACQHLIKPNVTIKSFFFEGSGFNARARKDGDCYSIGISAAVIPILLYLLRATIKAGAHFLASDPISVTEQFLTKEYDELLLDEELYQPLTDGNNQFLLEKCMVIALDIIVSHELIHILNGHLGWLEQSGVVDVDEIHLAENEYLRDQLQVLEYDADSAGILRSWLRSFGFALNDVNGLNSEQIFVPLPYGPNGTTYETLFAYSLALAATVSFFEVEDINFESKTKHPRGWFRREIAYQNLSEFAYRRLIKVGNSEAESLAYYSSPVQKGFSNVDRVWEQISGVDTGYQTHLTNPLDYKKLHLLDKYFNGWKQLFPHLYNYKLVASAWDAF